MCKAGAAYRIGAWLDFTRFTAVFPCVSRTVPYAPKMPAFALMGKGGGHMVGRGLFMVVVGYLIGLALHTTKRQYGE